MHRKVLEHSICAMLCKCPISALCAISEADQKWPSIANGSNELGDAFEFRCAHKSLNESYLYSLHGFINILPNIDCRQYMANAVFGVYSFSMSIISYAYEEGTGMYNLHYVITAVDMPIVL